jgi:hypothetical protein
MSQTAEQEEDKVYQSNRPSKVLSSVKIGGSILKPKADICLVKNAHASRLK